MTYVEFDPKLLIKAVPVRTSAPPNEIKEIGMIRILASVGDGPYSLSGDPHFASSNHVGRMVHFLLMDAAMGRCRRAARMWCRNCNALASGMTYDINGVRKYVSSGKCIAYPCMSYAKDANGSHPNGMVFLAMKAIDEGRAVLTLSKGVHVELQLDDFASFSLSLVYWHPETDGTKGRYESNDVVHLEAVTIPRTI
jgi:hypothetical protein